MEFIIPAKPIIVTKETDVLVVGGGPAGVCAAVAAARGGSKVILLEKNAFLGGNITAGYVETCNGFLRGNPYTTRGMYAEIVEKYRAKFGNSDDIRPGSPHRFSSEYLKIFLDKFVTDSGAEILFHSFVNDVIVQGDNIACVIIQTKQGPVGIKAKTIIDCTGDGDVAVAAGIPFDQGRDTDHLCQPGTVAFRIAGVDVEKLTKDGKDRLFEISRQYLEEYKSGKTGLKCKRLSLPFGRLTPGGQITYVNYPCAYGIDPTDIVGLSRGEMECREYILEMLYYMREHFDGFQNVELSSMATEIGFRDSRRIHGEYKLTIDDMEANRHFDDVITLFPRFYDMLTVDPDVHGDGSVKGGGYNGHIYEGYETGRTFEIPYRTLLPVNMENLMVAGRCISADHVAESGIRAVMACMYTGQAAGSAASIALGKNIAPKGINISELQDSLRKQNIDLGF